MRKISSPVNFWQLSPGSAGFLAPRPVRSRKIGATYHLTLPVNRKYLDTYIPEIQLGGIDNLFEVIIFHILA